VKEATYHGVPMIFFPFFNDGPGNMARAVYHGTGRRGSLGGIAADVARVLGSDRFETAASRLSRSVRAEHGDSEITSFLARCRAG
jgi:UDP:flavonoid glycosyltransferase YjiC (YdhE family)